MTIIGTFPATIANGQVEDATVVMSLFAWIQAQTNGNACPATVGTLMLKADGFGGTLGATDGTDFLSPTTGATNAIYTQAGTGAVARTVQDKARESVSVKDFGAKGDGVTDDTTAIQAAINYTIIVGGALYFPAGTYKITSALTVDTGVYTKGIILYGDGRNSIISQTGAGLDAIKFSTTQFLQNSAIKDMQVVTSATAGHCINIVYGCTTCYFDNVELNQGNPAKSCLFGDYTSFGGGVYDTKFRGGNWICNAASTVPGVQFIAKGTIFNENLFENIRCYNANTAQFFKITTATTASIWLVNNTWKNINFEVCKGGGFAFDSFKNCKFEDISFWDAGGAYTNNLIDMLGGVGYESAFNTFINVGRNGDSLTGCKDIRIVSGQDTTFMNCYTQAADSPIYDLGNKRVTVLGKLFGTVSNLAGMTVLNSIDGLRFPGTINGASLNYYDEGTWTATLIGSTAAPTVPVTITARWTRVGREVLVEGVFGNVNMTGSTGVVQITGIPFACGSVNATGSAGLLSLGTNPAICTIISGSTTINITQAANIGAGIPVGTTSVYLYFSVKYTV